MVIDKSAHRARIFQSLHEQIPFIRFHSIKFELLGDELTIILPFNEMLIGNPDIPAIHGGVTASLLEMAARMELIWSRIIPSALCDNTSMQQINIRVPKTISFTVDYLRAGRPTDAYARATVNRAGRRYASVHVNAWQGDRSRLFAQGTGHFIMVPDDG